MQFDTKYTLGKRSASTHQPLELAISRILYS